MAGFWNLTGRPRRGMHRCSLVFAVSADCRMDAETDAGSGRCAGRAGVGAAERVLAVVCRLRALTTSPITRFGKGSSQVSITTQERAQARATSLALRAVVGQRTACAQPSFSSAQMTRADMSI